MKGRFDYFVILADMRTGSNFLESNLNAIDGITCHGEAFNPNFIGYPNRTEILGVTQAMREAEPEQLIGRIRRAPGGISGFRLFHDHDPRALDICLGDPCCAKIVLTRNPAESYVSLKIAQQTGQWKLTNVKRRKDARVRFDPAEFDAHVSRLQAFQVYILNRLQRSGQTAFYLDYEDLTEAGIINGLARFLGVDGQLDGLDGTLKIQNPEPLSEKVENFGDMQRAVSGMDRFNLSRTPNFEPRRGPAVPHYIAAVRAPLLYMPVHGGPESEVSEWLAALDGMARESLMRGMNQKDLRQWKRRNIGHRSFTVLRHPVARAHAAFCTRILNRGPQCLNEIRKTMRNFHKVPIPGPGPDETYDRVAHRAAFEAFLKVVKANLRGQTGLRVDPSWATQVAVLQGMAQLVPPDLVLREQEIAGALPALAAMVGYDGAPAPEAAAADMPIALSEIYDDGIEALAADIYQRDYEIFGFGPWTA